MIQSLPSQPRNAISTASSYLSNVNTTDFEAFYDKYAPAFYGEIKRKLYKDDVSQKVMVDSFTRIRQLIAHPHNKNTFVAALQVVNKEISRTKVDLVLNQILSESLATKQAAQL